MEIVSYVALALLAIAVVWAAHVAARRVRRSNQRLSRFATIGVTGVTVFVTVLATLYGVQEAERHAWPTVVVSQRGTDLSDPIYLAGKYAVEWTAIGGQSPCHLAATLRGGSGDGDTYAEPLVDETIPVRTNTGGPTTFLTVDRAAYFVDTTADCPSWSITLTPHR